MAAGTTAVFTFCINAPLFHICILTVTETLSMRLYEHSYGCKWVKVLLSSNKQTNQVTEWSRVILRKLIDPLLVKFSMCYGIQRFITIFPCLLLHIPNDIYIYLQSLLSYPVSLTCTSISSFCLSIGCPSGLSSSGLPTKNLCVVLFFSIHATFPAHLILLHLITHTAVNRTNFGAPHCVILSSLLLISTDPGMIIFLFWKWLWFFFLLGSRTLETANSPLTCQCGTLLSGACEHLFGPQLPQP